MSGFEFFGKIAFQRYLPVSCICSMCTLYSPGCDQGEEQVDVNSEEQALLAVYEKGKRAHMNTDVGQLLTNTGETFISVSNGKISRDSTADIKKFFESYFENATYHEYNDLEAPIVRVSSDGTLGWIISRLYARRTQIGKSGAINEREFVYAGIMLYEKRAGEWIRIGNVSTFE